MNTRSKTAVEHSGAPIALNTWDMTVFDLKAMCRRQKLKGYARLNRVALVYLLDSKSTAPPREYTVRKEQRLEDARHVVALMTRFGGTRMMKAKHANRIYQCLLETRFSIDFRFTPARGKPVGPSASMYYTTHWRSAELRKEMGDEVNTNFEALRRTLDDYDSRSNDYGMTILLSLNRHLPSDMIRLIAQDFI